MLIHLCPKFLLARDQHPGQRIAAKRFVVLETLTIPELGITLTDGKELTTRRPYPNKLYYVGCRRVGQKAQNGILIETERQIRTFTARMTWNCMDDDHDHGDTEHVIHYRILDDDYDTVSDDSLLWYGRSAVRDGKVIQDLPSRMPAHLPSRGTQRITSYMQSWHGDYPGEWASPVNDVVAENGQILLREQVMDLPTIERVRMTQPHSLLRRVPPLKDAFSTP